MKRGMKPGAAGAMLLVGWLSAPAHGQEAPAQPIQPDQQAQSAQPTQPAGAATETGICSRPMLAPIELPLRDDGIDAVPGACGRTVLDARLRGTALLDLPAFYGTLAGSFMIGIRYKENNYFQWELGTRAIDYRFAQNASLVLSEIAYGPAYVGAAGLFSARLGDRDLPLAWSPSLRVSIPFSDSGYDIAVTTMRPAVAATLELSERVHIHGRGALLLWLAGASDRTRGRVAVSMAVDGAASLRSWLAVTMGTEVQSGWYGLGLDHWLMRGALRVRLAGRYRLELGAAVPLVGSERTDVVLGLGASRDLDR